MPRHVDPIPELKRQLGAALATAVFGWNGDDIAALLGTDRSRIAELRRGKLDRFSLETLVRFLAHAGVRVEMNLTPVRVPKPASRSATP